MKRNTISFILCALFAGIVTMGFECSSGDYEGAKLYIQQKNYDKALPLLEKEVKAHPTNGEAWYLIGRLKAETSDMAGMSMAFDSTLKYSDKHNSDVYNVRLAAWGLHLTNGAALLKRATADSTEFYGKAIAELNLAIIAKPDTAMTYEYLGSAYYNKGDIDSAIIVFSKPWEFAKDAEMYKQAGKIYINRGAEKMEKFETANKEKLPIAKLLRDSKNGITKTDVIHALGLADATKKDKKNPKKEEWTYTKYNVTFTIENEKAAFPKAFKLDMDSTQYYAAAKDFDKATEIFEAVKENNPKDNENLNLLLQSYVRSNRIAEATRTFKLAVQNEPGNKTNHYILGILYRTIGEFTSAIEEYKAALQIDPEYSDATYKIGATYFNWGVDLYRKSSDKGSESTEYKAKFQEALPYIEKISEIKKDDPTIWQTLGTIYLRLGMQDKAMKALDQADKLRGGK